MTDTTRRSLRPMDAIEFAIAAAFRHFFFGIRLALGWQILLLPLLALAWFMAFRNGPPDFKALNGGQSAALAALGVANLLASFSIAVNWHRRVLTGESPRGFGWVRLDMTVWRYMLGFLLLVAVLAIYAGAIVLLLTQGVAALAGQLGPITQPSGFVVAGLLGLSALFTAYRLWSWLAGIAVCDPAYGLGTAWRVTRGNRVNYLFFTFWLLFTLAVAGGLGAGAYYGQKFLAVPWVSWLAFALIGALQSLAVFFLMSVAAAHYRSFALSHSGE